MTLSDVLAAFGAVFDAVTEAIFAMSFGFAMVPSALAFLVGIIGCLAFNSVVPISFQAETITMAGSLGRNTRERISIVFFSGISMALIGAFGLLSQIVAFAGEDIIYAMMAGVGIILTKISIDLVKEDIAVGASSMVAAIATYILTEDLVYTVMVGVIISSVVAYFFGTHPEIKDENKKFVLQKPIMNLTVLKGALAVICISIGGNIAFGSITADIAGTTANADHISIYSGIADAVSSIFGGAPISVIISPTGAADNAQLSAIILMAIMGVILITGLLPKIAKFIPVQAISGTLFVLGAILTTPEYAQLSLMSEGSNVMASGITMVVTAVSNPFFGLISGIFVKMIGFVL
ncbi:MAG: NCS2 family permease [Bacillota bacterium]